MHVNSGPSIKERKNGQGYSCFSCPSDRGTLLFFLLIVTAFLYFILIFKLLKLPYWLPIRLEGLVSAVVHGGYVEKPKKAPLLAYSCEHLILSRLKKKRKSKDVSKRWNLKKKPKLEAQNFELLWHLPFPNPKCQLGQLIRVGPTQVRPPISLLGEMVNIAIPVTMGFLQLQETQTYGYE